MEPDESGLAKRRSPKAGRPPTAARVSSQARRRQRTAHAAFTTGTTIHEAADGPRVRWGVAKPNVKKR